MVCTRCDRGQRYCGEPCRRSARARSVREASRRYQKSPLGARNHAVRQMRYRASRRGPVTHQGSPIGSGVVFLMAPGAVVARGESTEEGNDEPTDEKGGSALAPADHGPLRCSFCGVPCGHFTRTGYLPPHPRMWRWHRRGARL